MSRSSVYRHSQQGFHPLSVGFATPPSPHHVVDVNHGPSGPPGRVLFIHSMLLPPLCIFGRLNAGLLSLQRPAALLYRDCVIKALGCRSHSTNSTGQDHCLPLGAFCKNEFSLLCLLRQALLLSRLYKHTSKTKGTVTLHKVHSKVQVS